MSVRPARATRDWTCPLGLCDGSGHVLVRVRDAPTATGRCDCFDEMVAWRQAHASRDERRTAESAGRRIAPACQGCTDCVPAQWV
jgi:hypothetical protein